MQDGYHLQYVSPHTVEAWSQSYLAWYLRILRAKTNRDGLPEKFTITKRETVMVPELRGLGASLRLLKQGLAEELKGVPGMIAAINEAIVPEIKEMKGHLAATARDFDEVKSFNKEMREGGGANSSDPIKGSAATSEPRKSWTNGSGQQHEQTVQQQQAPQPGVDMGAGSQS